VALFESFAVLVAKIASASTVAQVTAALGIAVAGVTGAGAAGVLPGAVQDGVARAVESVSPFDLPDSADDRGVPAVETETDDSGLDGPGDLPSAPTAVPSPTPATETHPAEPGDDGGVHQNRGGAVPTAGVRTDNSGRDHAEDDAAASPSPSDAVEVEDHAEDGSHHGGGDSGGSHGGSDDDSSGHGGGDDH
jgi:hypothetical protein